VNVVDQDSASSHSLLASASTDSQDAIRQRAQEIYIRNGSIPGRDLENWTQAEREVLHEREFPGKRTAVMIDVAGVLYVGEYRPESCDGYQPGEFDTADQVPVRFEGVKMFVRRPNGKELETTVVNRVG
jgi:hypothetical protein